MRSYVLAIGLAVLLFSSSAWAEIGRFKSAFEGMTRARISIVIGGPLDLEGGPALRLFGGDQERAKLFDSILVQSISSKLAACDIKIDESIDSEITIRIYGRPARNVGQRSEYIFLVEIGVFNASQDKDKERQGFMSFRPVIGLAHDSELEAVLSDIVLAILSEELKDCPPRVHAPSDDAV